MRTLSLAPWLMICACGGASASENTGSTPAKHAARSDQSFRDFASLHGIQSLSGASGGGNAQETTVDGLRLERIDREKPVKLDGVLTEWPPLARASLVSSPESPAKIAMTIGLQYDDAHLYVGGEVTDASFRVGQDHVTLTLAFPQPGGYQTYELALYAGKPGESEGSVRSSARARVPGAKIVEAPTQSGYTFEAVIALSAIPESRVARIGVHGMARYVHGDAWVSTGPGDSQHPGAMPWVPSESELSMIEQLLTPKGLGTTAPHVDQVADLTGDGVLERVAVFDRYLTICGSAFLGGTRFFYRDLGGELVTLDLRDVSGRGHEDVVVRRRATDGGATREYLEVLSVFGANEEPRVTFSHEIAVSRADRRIDNAVHVGRGEIDVTVERATRWDALSYKEPIVTDVEPILLPWGPVRSQTWRWDGSQFAKAREQPQKEQLTVGEVTTSRGGLRQPAGTDPKAEPPSPKVLEGGDLSARMLDAYRRDRGVGANIEAKVNLKVQIAGDPRPERLVLLGRDLVVFGPGFKGGTGYAYSTLSQFADPSDITDVSARDVTGDGAADILVRGQRHPRPNSEVMSEVLLIYTIRGDSITRIFGIETARSQGTHRIQGLVQLLPAAGAKSFDILAAPGRANGWTEKTYPWEQDQPGVGDLEPLLLPWGSIRNVRYSWNGSAFERTGD